MAVWCRFCALALVAVAAGHAQAFLINVDQSTGEPAVNWTQTASGTRTANGQPITLTWGFVDDGTAVSGGGAIIGDSDLISTFNTTFDGNPRQSDHRQQPWFRFFEDSFGRWGELSGATYVFEPNDPGGTLGSSAAGALGFRPDIRIGGTSIDGSSGTLAFNFLPDGGGDMVLDTDDSGFFALTGGNHVRLRNTIMHEHGHGFGVRHVESTTDSLLMQPFISASFDGPQLDDIRAVQFYFGDANEKSFDGRGNGGVATATPLGILGDGRGLSVGGDANIPNQRVSPSAIDFVSVSNAADIDYYSFTINAPMVVSAELIPRGGVFTQSGQGGTPTSFDANARSDLELGILDPAGRGFLASANDAGLGETETIDELSLTTAGTYFVRVRGTEDTIQMYELRLTGATLIVPLQGDYNDDGVVDAADYTVWRDSLGSTVDLAADGDGSGTIDTGDYQVWRSNFGSSNTAGELAAAVVPEPATAIGMMCGLTWILFIRADATHRRRLWNYPIARCRTSRD